jgi:hypothetical protein
LVEAWQAIQVSILSHEVLHSPPLSVLSSQELAPQDLELLGWPSSILFIFVTQLFPALYPEP